MKTEKINADEVEVINNSSNPEKITKVRVDDDSGNFSGTQSVEDFLNNMRENSGANNGENLKNNPMMNMMGNIEEIKKIKPYFLIALLSGFWSLFGWTMFMAPLAILCGTLDLSLGSKFTQKASYIGIIFALIGLILEFKLF